MEEIPLLGADQCGESLGLAPARIEVMDADRLQAAADHFAWMKRPAAVAEALAEDFSISSPGTIDDRPRLAHTSAP